MPTILFPNYMQRETNLNWAAKSITLPTYSYMHVPTCPLILFLHTGQFLLFVAQFLQQTRWQHGRNVILTFLSLHILQNSFCLSSLFSSLRDFVPWVSSAEVWLSLSCLLTAADSELMKFPLTGDWLPGGSAGTFLSVSLPPVAPVR